MAYLPVGSESSDRITVLDDDRHLKDLISSFPTVNPTTINRIWDEQHSWDACFDMLKSLVCTHGTCVLSSEDCKFVDDLESWPPLSESEILKDISNLSSSISNMTLKVDKFGWTICDIDDESDWILIPSEEEETEKTSVPVENSRPSYRDALLMPHRLSSPSPSDLVQVFGHGRGKRVCQPALSVSSSQAHKRPAIEQVQAEEEDQSMDFYDMYCGVKSPAVSARTHCATVRKSLKRLHVDKRKSLRCKY